MHTGSGRFLQENAKVPTAVHARKSKATAADSKYARRDSSPPLGHPVMSPAWPLAPSHEPVPCDQHHPQICMAQDAKQCRLLLHNDGQKTVQCNITMPKTTAGQSYLVEYNCGKVATINCLHVQCRDGATCEYRACTRYCIIHVGQNI